MNTDTVKHYTKVYSFKNEKQMRYTRYKDNNFNVNAPFNKENENSCIVH